MEQNSKDNQYSIIKKNDKISNLENIIKNIFLVCAITSVITVILIMGYMLYVGGPAIFKVGIFNFLFGINWEPTSTIQHFGILYMVLTSIIGTMCSVAIGVPLALLTAVYLSQIASKKMYGIVYPVIEILAGIPSVVYGLIGIIVIVPVMGDLEHLIFSGDKEHTFTGGANLLSAIIILAIMILPTVVSVSNSALRATDKTFKEASLALGATKMQTIFKVILPAAKSGISTGIVLGISRAVGEAMAIIMVSGNSVNFPFPFNSVRFLTTGIVSEMSYSTGLHREVLFAIGLVLFLFVMLINIVLNKLIRRGGVDNG